MLIKVKRRVFTICTWQIKLKLFIAKFLRSKTKKFTNENE